MAEGRAALAVARSTDGDDVGRAPEDLGVAGLVLLAQFHGVPVDPDQLAHQSGRGGELFDEAALLLAARQLGLKARIARIATDRIDKLALPALAWQPDGEHFIVAKANEQQVLIQDLRMRRPQVLTREQFAERYLGRLLLVASRA